MKDCQPKYRDVKHFALRLVSFMLFTEEQHIQILLYGRTFAILHEAENSNMHEPNSSITETPYLTFTIELYCIYD